MIESINSQLIRQSIIMANLAKSCYSHSSFDVFSQYGYEQDHKVIHNKWTYAHAGSNDKTVVIALKGTNTRHLHDFIADIDIWPVEHNSAWVHRGFRKRASVILSLVIKYLENHAGKNIILTGHSLGGAIALILASELEQHGLSNIRIYTYGMPRVGNRAYCNLIKSPHYRFVNCNDMVPKIPTSIIGYRHHGNLNYLSHDGTLTTPSNMYLLKDRFVSRMNLWKRGKIFDNFTDHRLTSYIKKLSDLASDTENQI